MTPRLLVVTGALVLCGVAAAAQVPQREAPGPLSPESSVATDARIARVGLWLKALLDHEQGIADQPLTMVASWWGDDLQALWLDVNSLVRLMRSPGTVRFSYQSQRDPKPRDIRYSPAQLTRLRAFACLASGTAREPACATILRQRGLVDDDLLELAIRVQDSKRHGRR